jgi:hypothetical protein
MRQDIELSAKGVGAFPCIVASGQSLSPEVDLEGFHLTGIAVPLAFTGTQISFQAAERGGGTFQNVRDATGAEVVLTVAADRLVAIGATTTLAYLRYLRIRSGTAASPTTQGSNVRLLLIRKQGG